PRSLLHTQRRRPQATCCRTRRVRPHDWRDSARAGDDLRADAMKTLVQRLLHLLRWSRHGADLREEIETHRSLRQDALARDGLGADDAVHASRRAIGNIPLAIEDAREVWAMRALDH